MSISISPQSEDTEDTDNPRHALVNKVRVSTKYSQDGRHRETLYIDYDPSDSLSLFLLEKILNGSDYVEIYSVYGPLGDLMKNFNRVLLPKRI